MNADGTLTLTASLKKVSMGMSKDGPVYQVVLETPTLSSQVVADLATLQKEASPLTVTLQSRQTTLLFETSGVETAVDFGKPPEKDEDED